MARSRLAPHGQETYDRAQIVAEFDYYLAQLETLGRQGSTNFKVSYDSFGRFTGFSVLPSEQRLLPRRGEKTT